MCELFNLLTVETFVKKDVSARQADYRVIKQLYLYFVHTNCLLIFNFQIRSVVCEKYDYNTFDDSGIVGPHPYHNNLYFAAGFGRLGKIYLLLFMLNSVSLVLIS